MMAASPKLEINAMQSTVTINTTYAKCAMCDGVGGWRGHDKWMICRPCEGTGKEVIKHAKDNLA